MGYHIAKIPEGNFGAFSKVEEEFLELRDAQDQQNPVLMLCEMSDLIAAYAASWNISLDELVRMTKATERAFQDGSRK